MLFVKNANYLFFVVISLLSILVSPDIVSVGSVLTAALSNPAAASVLPHLSLLPLLLERQLLAAAQLPACVGQFGLQLGHAAVQGGRVLAALRQLLVGPIQDLLEFRHAAAVVVGVDGAVGQPLRGGRAKRQNCCTCMCAAGSK